ncbi:hypothetical protein [Cohnella thermotolerans]|uniref:hypothetical protein n=1 Tax=Cohnella thermotolerans TaxID=329858 RepID=UPI000405A1A9|nr:hypothetical protein [Cohnella thermotolerans]
MKKWIAIIASLVVLLFAGYKVGMNYVSDKVMDKLQNQIVSPEEVEELKKDPEIQKIIKQQFTEDEVKKLLPQADVQGPSASSEAAAEASPSKSGQAGAKPGSSTTAKPGSPAAAKPDSSSSAPVKALTRKQAEDLVMSKFSIGELKKMADMAKDGLSDEEKEEIKAKLKSKLTDEEYQELKVTALIEMLKKDA